MYTCVYLNLIRPDVSEWNGIPLTQEFIVRSLYEPNQHNFGTITTSCLSEITGSNETYTWNPDCISEDGRGRSIVE